LLKEELRKGTERGIDGERASRRLAIKEFRTGVDEKRTGVKKGPQT